MQPWPTMLSPNKENVGGVHEGTSTTIDIQLLNEMNICHK